MIPNDFLNRHWRGVFLFLCVVCALIVVGFFASFYIIYGHDGLPIGWDTPRYVGQMFSISREGALSFIQENECYNPGYAIFSSTLVLAGLSPFVVEIVLPIALCFFIVMMSGILVKRIRKDGYIAVYTMLFAASWFAVYRLGADLHSNLLAMALLLTDSYFFLMNFEEELSKWRQFWFFLLLILASFTHVETAMFFTLILLVSALWLHTVIPSKYSLRKMLIDVCLMLVLILPSVIFYVQHMTNLLSYTKGVLISNPLLSIDQWIHYLGILLPIAILGLCLTLKNTFGKMNNPYNAFISSWALASIAFALAQYAFPEIQIFSDRALMLFPVPFVAGVGLKAIFEKIRLTKTSCTLINRRQIIGMSLVSVILMSSLFFTYAQVVPAFRVWISPSAYEKLTWLSNHYKPEEMPIFVFNNYDESAGGLGILYNDWVQAIYGNHYSYLGRLDFLLALTETRFRSVRSQQISAMFLQKMQCEGVFTMTGILLHKVIIITDYYLPSPLPLYDRALFDEVYDGIFVLNSTKLKEAKNVYVPLYSNMWYKTGNWNSTERNWTKSIYALEFWEPNPSNLGYGEILISITNPGNYSFAITYWDGSGSDMVLKLNDRLLGEIRYMGTNQSTEYKGDINIESTGIYVFKIVLTYVPGERQYASLDYLEISLNGE